MIVFKKLTIEGFGSIVKRQSIDLDTKGVRLILGNNAAGKSTIILALIWAIYGKLIGKDQVETWEQLRGKDFLGTYVELILKVDGKLYKIIRCKNYLGKVRQTTGKNQLFLISKHGVDYSDRNKTDIQKSILELIGYTQDIFCNSIVLGQNLTRILDERGDKQKAILDQAFNTAYIQRAKDLAKKDLDKINTTYAEKLINIEGKEGLIEMAKDSIEILEKGEQEFKKNNKIIIDELKRELAGLQTKAKGLQYNHEKYLVKNKQKDKYEKALKKLLPKLDVHVKTDNELFRTTLRFTQLRGEYEDNKAEGNKKKAMIAGFAKKHTTCPTCRQLIDDTTQIKKRIRNEYKAIEMQGDEILDQIGRTNHAIGKLEEKLKSLKGVKEETNRLKEKIKLWESKIAKMDYHPSMLKSNKAAITRTKSKLEDSKKEKYLFDKKTLLDQKCKLRDLKKALSSLNEEVESIKYEKDLLEWLVKSPLSSKGLRVFIFDQLLQNISERTYHYSAISGCSVDLSIDMNSAVKNLKVDVNIDGMQTSYNSLSGGQKQLANITVAFAIHDVKSQINKVNLQFLDEVFENLDKTNIQVVSDLVSMIAEEKTVNLITHRSEFVIYNSTSITLTKTREAGTLIF